MLPEGQKTHIYSAGEIQQSLDMRPLYDCMDGKWVSALLDRKIKWFMSETISVFFLIFIPSLPLALKKYNVIKQFILILITTP